MRKKSDLKFRLQTEMNLESGEPRDELHSDTLSWFKTLGVDYKTLAEVIAAGPCPKVNYFKHCFIDCSLQFRFFFLLKVFAAINEGISRANKHATSNAQKIQKFAILPHDFSIPTGELGPTLKVKRNVVNKKYEDVIENFYA